MANRTDKEAADIRGTNPQNLIERILRLKVYETTYWKQHCFGLTAATVLDKAADLRSVGGSVGPARKPSRFVCLTLKLLQIQPDPGVILEYIKQDDLKYVRLLGAFYWRLTARPADVFRYLEPLLADARRVRVRHPDGAYALSHVDEVVDTLLTGETLFDVALPRLPPRRALVGAGALAPRASPLAAEFEVLLAAEKEEAAEKEAAAAAGAAAAAPPPGEDGELPSASLPPPPPPPRDRRRSRSRSPRRGDYGDDDRRRRRSRSPRRREKWQLSRADRDRAPYGRRDDRDRKRRSRSRSPRRRSASPPKKAKGDGDALSIDETNRLRASLGLPPLK